MSRLCGDPITLRPIMGAITWPPSSLVFALAMSSDAPCRTIVFSHANSFPASTYRPLFAYWREAGFNVQAVEQYGHDPRYPVTQDWPHLVEQLRDFIVQQGASPVYLVGHSLGGYLSLMLAARFPQLAQGVVVLDSPLVNGWRAMSLPLARATGLIDRVMPSGIAAQRCHEWPSLSATRQHFQAKPKFAAFHPEVFNAYVSHGTADHAVTSVRHLRFDRQVEAAIYRHFPGDLWQHLRRHPLHCPTAFIGGTRSGELRRVGLSATRQIFGQHLSWLEGSHLYPMEDPASCAQAVLSWLNRFEGDA